MNKSCTNILEMGQQYKLRSFCESINFYCVALCAPHKINVRLTFEKEKPTPNWHSTGKPATVYGRMHD